jgi:hypothetical protein
VDWTQVWRNLHTTPVEAHIKDTWYKILHDINPTKERLYKIHLSASNVCDACNIPDTIQHRLVECGNGERIWAWTKFRMSLILRTDPSLIPDEWLFRPQFRLWPPQRHRAVLWFLATFVEYQGQRGTRTSRHGLHDFFLRSRWKIYQKKKAAYSFGGNYLSVLDM